MAKTSVAVVMGGYSDESVVSLKSGALIYDSLSKERYDVHRVHILKEGWFYLDSQGQRYPLNKADFSVDLPSGKTLRFDVCFNIVHGRPGENGELQAYWDTIGQRYTGCDFYQSALTFNKKDTLAVLSKYGIPAAESFYIRKGEHYDFQVIVDTLGLPLFVKPNQSGSSLGISKVKTLEELPEAFRVAFKEDEEILVEKFLDGMEVSVGVVDLNAEPTVIGITEIVPESEFFDYAAKYEGKSQEITPARIDEATRCTIEQIALKAYRSLGMKGFSRSEFILCKGIPYMLEMNTNPGFSPQSILPQQARHYGISIEELCQGQVERALEKPKPHA